MLPLELLLKKITLLKLVREDSETVVRELQKQTCHSDVTHFAHFYKSRLSTASQLWRGGWAPSQNLTLCALYSQRDAVRQLVSPLEGCPSALNRRVLLSQQAGRVTAPSLSRGTEGSFCWSLGRDV